MYEKILVSLDGSSEAEIALPYAEEIAAKRGAKIVEGVESFENKIPMIRNHHERFDGNGYPDGLIGEVIPFGARIIAVSDAFDAMASLRPH